MALISSGGGRLKPAAPKGLFGHVGGGIRTTGVKVSHAVTKAAHSVPVKAPTVKAPTPVRNPATPAGTTAPTADPTTDPFAFIQGLTQTTDPAAIKALIDPIYAPQRDLVNQQIAQMQAQSQAQANQMKDVYAAFAQYMQGLPGQIQGIYGKGSDAYNQGAALGASMAGPQGAVGSHLAAAAGIDSNLMSEQGKNWAAYAAAQPGIYSLYATQQIKSMLGDEAANETKLRQDLLSLSSQEASDILKYLENAQSNDTSLKEWAFGQKQSQTAATNAAAVANQNARIKEAEFQLNYAQKDAAEKFNQWKVEQSLGHTAQAQADLNAYRQAQVRLRVATINAQNARSANAQAGANARAAASQAGANARAAASRAAKAALKGKGAKASTSSTVPGTPAFKAKVQVQVARQVTTARTWANARKAKYGGTQTTKGTTGSFSLDQASRRQVYNETYQAFARTFFTYYRQLGYPHPQKLVDKAIRSAVGWGANG